MRNGTDPFLVEIQGLTMANDFGHLGFGAMYPLNLAVAGYVGECHRCFGVDVLVTGMSRNRHNSTECGVSAGTSITNVYIFTRAGPVCGTEDTEVFAVHHPGRISHLFGIKYTGDIRN